MTADDVTPDDVPAGDFGPWLLQIGLAGQDRRGADVPCGDCTACCTSSQFVHVGPDERDTLARIPKRLLFPAPGRPKGHVLLGYDENGHCPMFVDGRCSIYEDRPRTCRTYDCRVFPATGLEPDSAEGMGISERSRRWRFGFPTRRDREMQAAVQAAAAFLRDNADRLPGGIVPRNPTQVAFLAIRIHEVFLDPEGEPDGAPSEIPLLDVVEAAVLRVGAEERGDPTGRGRRGNP